MAYTIIIALAFVWLAYETDWMRVRLLVGTLGHKRNPWLDKMLLCQQCHLRYGGVCRSRDDRWFGYTITARTLKLFGSTLSFNEGCNYIRASMLKDIIKAQKSKAIPHYSQSINRRGFENYFEGNGIEVLVDGKQVASINDDYKRGMIKQALKPYTTKARVGKQTVTFDFGEADRLVKV